MSNLAPMSPSSASMQAASLIRYCKAILQMDGHTFAGWLRRIAQDIEAQETGQ